ncbi:MAG: DUF4468 domain-containing protein [Parabacteroides sp.]
MKQLFVLLVFIPLWLSAQTGDSRYLAGAVPMQNGKIIFTKEIQVPNQSRQQIFTTLLNWANQTYNTPERKVVFTDAAKGEIAVVSQEYLVFSSTALALDRTLATYRFVIDCSEGACHLEMSGFRYKYDVTYQREPELYVAEEWITDKMALNGKKTKLNHIAGKFRKATIDLVDQTFLTVTNTLGVQMLNNAQPAPAVAAAQPVQAEPAREEVAAPVHVEAPVQAAASLEGFMAFAPDKVPATLLQLLPESRMTLADADQKCKEPQAQWKGIGSLMGKSIASVAVSPESAVYKQIGENGAFRLSFCKAGEQEPWFIIDCRKQGETTDGGQKVLLGEILQIWVK